MADNKLQQLKLIMQKSHYMSKNSKREQQFIPDLKKGKRTAQSKQRPFLTLQRPYIADEQSTNEIVDVHVFDDLKNVHVFDDFQFADDEDLTSLQVDY